MYRELKYSERDLSAVVRDLEKGVPQPGVRRWVFFRRRISRMISRAMVDKAAKNRK